MLMDHRLRKTEKTALESRSVSLPQIRQGVPGALDSLLAREPSLAALVNAQDGLDTGEIQRIEDRSLIARAGADKRMAQGVTDPAEIDVLGIARKASGSLIPVP